MMYHPGRLSLARFLVLSSRIPVTISLSQQVIFPSALPMTERVFSVAELNREARQLLERHFPLFWVAGEISNLVRAASGHVYFSLKDSQAQVRCVMFRSRAQLLPWKLENGQQVEIQALVTLYEARGDFQLNVEGMRRAGIGRLYELFVKLKEKLAAEGMFAAERKREIPRYPRRVGIVTSPQAAALRDVIAAFARRAPHVELIVYPTLVQGAEAPAAIVAALRTAYAQIEQGKGCDLLLVVRGGGSIEDLWAFNDETVARTFAVSPAPTFSGIGHETDTTIADFVADRRAATPTAAAELASAGWFDAAAELADLADRLRRALQDQLDTHAQTLDRLALRLVHPAKRLASDRQRVELLARRLHAVGLRQAHARRETLARLQTRLIRGRPTVHPAHQAIEQLSHRLQQAIQTQIARRREVIARREATLAAISPTATLQRGYSIVRGPDGAIVRDAAHLRPGDALHLNFANGEADATVNTLRKNSDL
jgi:exodeoxyribonuclease VII large subunit